MSDFNNAYCSDKYQYTMGKSYLECGQAERRAVFNLFYRKAPENNNWAVVSGTDEVIEMVTRLGNESETFFEKFLPGDEYAMLFKLTDALTRDYSARKELFRRVALNVLAHNRDDHLKNFGFLMYPDGHWQLAPFYDFTYAEGPNGWQTLSVAGEGKNPGEADLLRLARDVDIDDSDAKEIMATIRHVLKTGG